MSSQKRILLFCLLSVATMYGTEFLMRRMGLIPPPKPPAVAQAEPAAPADAAAPAPDQAKPAAGENKPAGESKPPAAGLRAGKGRDVEAIPADKLVLGSADDPSPEAYHLRIQLDQSGATVREVASARYDGETADGIPDRKVRFPFIKDDPFSHAPRPFALTAWESGRRAGDAEAPPTEVALDLIPWEVVRDGAGGPIVRPVTRKLADGRQVEGQEIAFRSALDDPAAFTVTKRYRLWKGEDGFEVSLTLEAGKEARVQYRLFGPHGIPIEGESYTANFRDVFFGQVKGNGVQVATKSASDVVKAKDDPEVYQSLPLKFAGVENQYFAVLVEPDPTPTGQDATIEKAQPFVAREIASATQKSDVGVELVSAPVELAPGRAVKHDYKVFAGPKTRAALAPYGAEDLASYRKYQLITIPFASSLAQNVIAPMLDRIYGLTAAVARTFGFKNGSYGVAIILLTITVRLLIFPIGRKQAMISKKMQELQPHLAAIKEKYKDDKERQTKETLNLYRTHGFNPAAGCLPAVIQLPIFVGLWQALNNSVALRHSTFLYIKNLAAPDMLFRFPTELPIVGKYFNLLPFFVVALMLVQTKLFSPPAITEEQRMQQKMMKYMMVFMAFMFYKVPSGLGLYFITSSLWSIGERLILPKLTGPAKVVPVDGEGDGHSAPLAPAPAKPAGGVNGWLSKKLESLMEQAEAERTIRNNPNGAGSGRGDERDRDRNRNRPRPGKRR